MQRVTVVRYTTKPGRADENEKLTQSVFAELKGKPGQPFAYAVLRDGDDFLHMFLNLQEDDASVLTELESFKAFSAEGPERWTAPPEIIRSGMRLLGAYGFEAALAPA
jgi:quinol monooxygenase YgiN